MQNSLLHPHSAYHPGHKTLQHSLSESHFPGQSSPPHVLHTNISSGLTRVPFTPEHCLCIHPLHPIHLIALLPTPFPHTVRGHFPSLSTSPQFFPDTITFVLPMFIFNPFSMLSAIRTKSSAFNSSHGRASLTFAPAPPSQPQTVMDSEPIPDVPQPSPQTPHCFHARKMYGKKIINKNIKLYYADAENASTPQYHSNVKIIPLTEYPMIATGIPETRTAFFDGIDFYNYITYRHESPEFFTVHHVHNSKKKNDKELDN